MDSHEALKVFEAGYVDNRSLTIDNATMLLAEWFAQHVEILTIEERNLFVSIGVTLFGRGIEARLEFTEPARQATVRLMEQLRWRK